MLIYLIRNKTNGKVYVGKTGYNSPIQRFNVHVREAFEKDNNRHILNAIRKYGKKNFECSVLCPNCATEGHTNSMEQYWISRYRSNSKRYGYNMTLGGDGRIAGWKASRETRLKMSEALKGRYPSKETRRKLSIAAKNRKPMSEETRRKISQSVSQSLIGNKRRLGTHQPKEFCRNLSRRNRGSGNPMFGKHLSAAARLKISRATTNFWKQKRQEYA